MGRVACESRLPFFRWYTLLVFYFFILVYRITDPSGGQTRSFRNHCFLMVIRLFRKKAVPLYIKEKDMVLTN